MIVRMLQPGGLDLARRWLAALLLVDEADRPALVEEVERRVTELCGQAHPDEPPEVHVIHPPVQRPGYVEQVHATYGLSSPREAPARPKSRRKSG